MRSRLSSLALVATLLAGCSGGGSCTGAITSTDPAPAATASAASSSLAPTLSATDDYHAVFAALAVDAPPLPRPDGDAMYSVALAEHGADYSPCLITPSGGTACKKPASLGSRDLRQTVNVEVVLDASGLMKELSGGRTKIDVAKEAIAAFVTRLPKNARVAVRTFGNGADEPKDVSCASSRLVVPFQPADPGRIRNALGRTTVQGYTPLADALAKAKADFAD